MTDRPMPPRDLPADAALAAAAAATQPLEESPVPVPPVYYPAPPVGGIDCSPAAQARRWQALQELEARLFSGVQSVSDRNRQVSFMSPKDIAAQINLLRSQMNFCQTGQYTPRLRLRYYPQAKDL